MVTMSENGKMVFCRVGLSIEFSAYIGHVFEAKTMFPINISKTQFARQNLLKKNILCPKTFKFNLAFNLAKPVENSGIQSLGDK